MKTTKNIVRIELAGDLDQTFDLLFEDILRKYGAISTQHTCEITDDSNIKYFHDYLIIFEEDENIFQLKQELTRLFEYTTFNYIFKQ